MFLSSFFLLSQMVGPIKAPVGLQKVGCLAILDMEGSWDCCYRFPGLFYWAAMRSLTGQESQLGSLSQEDQDLALQLHRPPKNQHEDVLCVLEAVGEDQQLQDKLEELLQIWIYNSLRCLAAISFFGAPPVSQNFPILPS